MTAACPMKLVPVPHHDSDRNSSNSPTHKGFFVCLDNWAILTDLSNALLCGHVELMVPS